jgi:hypothetical protein
MSRRAPRGRLLGCVMVCVAVVGFAAPALGDVVSYTTAASHFVFSFDDDLVSPPSPWVGSQSAGDDNSLTVIPYDFRARSIGGSPFIDAVDGMFVLTITAKSGSLIHKIVLSENGDFDLFDASGRGTATTQVDVKAVIDPYVKVNNAWVMLASQHMAFSQNLAGPFDQDGNYDLASNPGMAQKWYGKVVLDIAAAAGGPVKEVQLVLDNKLLAVSEAGTYALIVKKRLVVDVPVPEPSTVVLLICGFCVLLAGRRR